MVVIRRKHDREKERAQRFKEAEKRNWRETYFLL